MNKKNKRVLIILLLISIIVISLVTYINMNIVYIGNNTKVVSLGNKIYSFNTNSNIILRKVYINKNGKFIKGFIKAEKENDSYDYIAVSANNRAIDVDLLIAKGLLSKAEVAKNVVSSKEITDGSINEVNVLLEANIDKSSVLNYEKMVFDIDNDASDESIYYVLYMTTSSLSTEIFIKDGEDIISVLSNEYDFETEGFSETTYKLTGLIDFNNDLNYEIVVSKVTGDDAPIYYDIYRYDNGKINRIK